MLPSPIAARMLLTTTLLSGTLLFGLLAANQPAQAQPTQTQAIQTQATQTQAAQTQAQTQLLPSITTDDVSPRRTKVAGKWSIKVHGWAKPFKRGDQARIDRCKATLWWGPTPSANADRTTWLAGHNYCGFWRWDKWLPVGAHFSMKSPEGNVRRYEVFRRAFINRKSGSSSGLILGDVTLQTCRGSGMTFVYARLLRS